MGKMLQSFFAPVSKAKGSGFLLAVRLQQQPGMGNSHLIISQRPHVGTHGLLLESFGYF